MRNFIDQTHYFAEAPTNEAGQPERSIEEIAQNLRGNDLDEDQAEEIYEWNQIFSSYLRCYKLLGKQQEIYREVQVSVCMPVIDKYLKETLNLRQS